VSTSEFSSSAPLLELTEKQKDLLNVFDSLISKHGINLEINPSKFVVKSPVAVDVEHDEHGEMVCIGAYDGERAYCWTGPLVGGWIYKHGLILHNGITDIELLRSWGIPVRLDQFVWDTMLIGHIIDSSKKVYGLKDMAKRELEIEYPDYDEIVGKKGLKAPRVTLDKQPLNLVAKYNAMDCYVTFLLYVKQRKALGNVSI
jgi:DNA polymerase I-like protein with 3'-5' exonuclease and polymerase domains